MGDTTGISWTDSTWNPVVGCTQIPGARGGPSGCDNCYAKSLVDNRLAKVPGTERFGKPFETVICYPVMALAPRHTFQVLTKRPDRMRSYMRSFSLAYGLGDRLDRLVAGARLAGRPALARDFLPAVDGLFPNVWLGTSVCSNADAWRALLLGDTPSGGERFLSVEPLLGDVAEVPLGRIDWVISGGESGPRARPMHPAWEADLRRRCAGAGIPYWFKQHGEFVPFAAVGDAFPLALGDPRHVVVYRDGRTMSDALAAAMPPDDLRAWVSAPRADGVFMDRVGKRAAGHLLGGVEHHARPPLAHERAAGVPV